VLLTCYGALNAQTNLALNDSTPVSVDPAVSYYYQFTDQRSRLYNGKEFIPYDPRLEGHPYFGDGEMHRGFVFYDGLPFDSVNILYDIVKDELIIQHFDVFFKIVLIPGKVKEFRLLDHRYVRLVKDSSNKLPVSTGYYDFLYEGNVMLIAKRTKHIDETVTDKINQKIVVKDFFYVIKDKVYYPVKSYKSLLAIFKDRSKEIRQDLRKNKIKFRKTREAAILRAVKFYDTSK
jgi:hypothetical protein